MSFFTCGLVDPKGESRIISVRLSCTCSLLINACAAINACVAKEPSSNSTFASTWVLSLVTVATVVFSRQIGSLVKRIDCKVLVVAVIH